MSTLPLSARYLWIVDTEDYAGNFEREMCAYLTGRVGKCGVGDDMAALFTEETGQEPFDNVMEEPDDHGCHRPASIYPTPGWFNHGMGGYFRNGDEAAALADYKHAMRKDHGNSIYHGYLKDWLNGNEDRYIKSGWTKAKLRKACANEEQEIIKAEARTKVVKWPAYLSVAISFATKPTAAQVALMKKRAFQFAALPAKTYGGPPAGPRISKVTGFRLIEQTIKREEKSLSV